MFQRIRDQLEPQVVCHFSWWSIRRCDLFHFDSRHQETARGIFPRRQFKTIIIFAVPRRDERVCADRKFIEFRLLMQHPDELIGVIVDSKADCSFHRWRDETEPDRARRSSWDRWTW